MAESGKISCDCQRLCQCFICPEDDTRDRHAEQLVWIGDRLERLEEKLSDRPRSQAVRRKLLPTPNPSTCSVATPFPDHLPSSTPHSVQNALVPEITVSPSQDAVVAGNAVNPQINKEPSFTEPFTTSSERTISKTEWMNVDYLKDGSNDIIDEMENQFWSGFLEEYLQPIQKTREEEAEIVVGLRNLRNNIAFAILVANGLLVLVIYLLQSNKDILSVEITPYENYTWHKFDPTSGKLETVTEPLLVEPIGLTIIVFLGLILGVQTLGMFIHRFHTASHVLASTVLSCFKRRKSRQVNGEKVLDENAIDIARNLQKLDDEYDNFNADFMSPNSRKRKREEEELRGRKKRKGVVYNLEQAKNRRKRVRGLQAAFQKRFLGFNPDRDARTRQRRESGHRMGYGPDTARHVAAVDAFARRREDVLKEKSISRAPSRLHSHVSQPGRAVALHRNVNRDLYPSPVFGGRRGRPQTFLDEINSELRRDFS